MSVARHRMGTIAAAAASAAVIVSGCGSTAPMSPTTPTPVQTPAAQYPSLVGEWGGSGDLVIQYRTGSRSSYGCDGSASVQAQNAGTFSGSAALRGHSLDTDKQCPDAFAFSAEMAADGTIMRFQTGGPLRLTTGCMALSDVSFSRGSASSAGFSVVMTDHAMCRSPLLDPRDPYSLESDRTFTLVIDRRRALVAGLYQILTRSAGAT